MSTGVRPASVWAGRVAETLLWAAACFSLWLLTLSSINKQDITAAAIAALPCGVLAVLARHVVQGAWRFELSPLARLLLLLPVVIVLDSVRLLAVPLRVLAGRDDGKGDIKSIRAPTIEGDDPAAAGRRALLGAGVSATPGTIIMDATPDGVVRVHQMVPDRPSMLEAVLGPPRRSTGSSGNRSR
jgi:multisubunit Na+/H+ antiporter MnhE subunit